MLRKYLSRVVFVLTLLAPLAAHAAEGKVAYSPEAVQSALDQGRAVLLEFYAPW